jgi:uncharacterized protein YecE (DUF72 family)
MVAANQISLSGMPSSILIGRPFSSRKAGASMSQDRSWTPMEFPPDCVEKGFLVGTSGYYFDDWIGRFNPPRASKSEMSSMTHEDRNNQDRLLFYQKYFSLVEINNTFYREADIEHFKGIEARSHPRTQYIVKAHRDLSHTRTWNTDLGRAIMRRQIQAVSPIFESGRFYSFLIQLEDHVQMSDRNLDYLRSVASEATYADHDVHIEFRHFSWHTRAALQSLKDSGIGICNTEIPPVKHAFPLKYYATTDKGYVRYSGRNLNNWYPGGSQKTRKEQIASRNARYDYLYSEDEVGERVLGQIGLRQKTSSVAVAYNNHYNAQAVMNGIMNLKILNSLVKEVDRPIKKEESPGVGGQTDASIDFLTISGSEQAGTHGN